MKQVFARELRTIRDIWQDLKPGQPPHTLMDYFPDDFLIMIDESHKTIPQMRRYVCMEISPEKRTLVDYGFRLPSALDNRPLEF